MASYNVRALGVYDENLELVGDTVLVEDGVVRGFRPASYAGDVIVEGYVTPAFVDAHLHITWLGLALNGVDLSGSRSPEEVAARLATARAGIAYGRGWDQEYFDARGSLPTRRLLDKYVPGKPAVAVRVCGHLAVLNTRALEATRIHEVYPHLVDREDGVVREDAVYAAVESLLGTLDVTGIVRDALREVRGHGVAGVSSMSCPASEARALASLEARGELGVRVSCYPRMRDLEEAASLLGGSRLARVIGVKEFADGSLGARTAYLSEDYNDDPGNRGMLLLSRREIEDLAGSLVGRGYRLAVHAIGDAALSEVVEAYASLGIGGYGRVEHASLAPPRLIDALAGLGVHVVVQPHFRVSDWWITDRLGEARARWAYPLKSMSSRGVMLAFSTDSPVEPLSPPETIAAAESRCSQAACRRDEALSRRESIYYYTRGSAEASGGPVGELGSMEPGRPAALIWFQDDPSTSGDLVNPRWVPIP